jgi:cytosine/adenosine deaminase-related metal-dependent hydrolase
MSYRKLKADFLFDGYRMLPRGSVLVCNGDGCIEAALDESQAGEDLEKFSGIIMPGFVNSHCHLELSHLKGLIPQKQGLVDFVLAVTSQRTQPDKLKHDAMIYAETSMLQAGIVAVGDICNTSDSVLTKSAERLSYYNFIEILGWAPEQAAARFEAGKKLAAVFKKLGLDEEHFSLGPHAPYSISKELWELLKPGFKGKTISIHNQESAAENEFFLSGTGDLARMYARMKMDTSHFKSPGTTSLPDFLPKLSSATKILLVHNIYTAETELKKSLEYRKNLFFCFCPNANMYIENRLPDIPLFLKCKANIVLGTDSLASNEQLSILEEIKTIKKYFPSVPTREMLVWATSNGAKALAFDDKLGDFARGKKPGIVLIEKINEGEIDETSTCRRLM